MRNARLPLSAAGLAALGALALALTTVVVAIVATPAVPRGAVDDEASRSGVRAPDSLSVDADERTAAGEPVSDVEPTVEPEAEVAAEQAPTRTHVVVEGESLRTIADANGLSVETLIGANPSDDPDFVQIGQELVVPAVDGALYTVVEGDTVLRIAERFKVDPDRLIAVNNMAGEPDVLSVGTRLVLPGVTRASVLAAQVVASTESARRRGADDSTSPSAPPQIPPRTYVVHDGDTLRSIAQTFGLDILSLLAANHLADPDVIVPGTTLRVTTNDVVEHTVTPGETLADIARRYAVPSAALLDANGVKDPDLIIAGTSLVVPIGDGQQTGGEVPSTRPPAAPPPAAPPPAAPPPPATTRPASPPTQRPATTAPASTTLSAKVTGYAPGAGAGNSRTASGTRTHWGTVAADTRLFPFGTQLRIEGLGDTVFVVEDTGSAVRGNVFDVWYPDASGARAIGAQTRRVTILRR